MYRRLTDPKISVCIVFVCAMFMSIMDTTVVNVALPALSKQFSVPSTSIDAVIVGYLVSLAVVIPVSGWLGDRWGTRRIFLCALALFTLASALCGLAQTLPMLVGFRVLQGMAGGALTPIGTTMLYRTYPPEERVSVSRILNVPTVIAPASGPVIGGLLVQQLSWRWVFYINVPIGLATLLFGIFFLRAVQPESEDAGHFDPAGFVLAGLGLALLMYALTEGPTYGWGALSILFSGGAGLLLVACFVFVELRVRAPMIDLRLLRDRLFRVTNLVTMFSSAGFLGLLFVAPLFLQEARGVSALVSGLTTFPEAVGVVAATQIVASLYPRVGPRRLVAAGLTGVTLILCLFIFLDLKSNLWLMRGLMFLTGAGMAFTFISTPAAAFATISPADTGKASAFYSAERQLGAALGIAFVGTMLSLVGPVLGGHGTPQPNLAAYHAAFLTSAALVLIAACTALFIHDSDAAATMKMRRKKPVEKPMESTRIARPAENVVVVE